MLSEEEQLSPLYSLPSEVGNHEFIRIVQKALKIESVTSRVPRPLADKNGLISLNDALKRVHNPVSYTHLDVYKRQVEGTMLTVIREAAEVLNEKAKPNWSIVKALEVMVAEAKASLERTPDLLPVLKEVGVVDSGGAGVVAILEGMLSLIHI